MYVRTMSSGDTQVVIFLLRVRLRESLHGEYRLRDVGHDTQAQTLSHRMEVTSLMMKRQA